MIWYRTNPTAIPLEITAVNQDSSPNTSIASGTVTVYHVTSGGTVTDLASTPLVFISGTTWRYRWTPATLSEGMYTILYTLTDTDGNTSKTVEDLQILDTAKESSITLAAADLTIIKKIETGKWEIVSDQMIFYDTGGVTPLLTFNLFDADGDPSSVNVYKRVPTP